MQTRRRRRTVDGDTVTEVRARLLAFYDAARRDLPWRRRGDAYAIWVSEIMLQQTQVETVRPRYERFLAEFPDVGALARAEEARVCEAWAGLGYYRRARHLHAAARRVVTTHGGELPRSVAELRALPGIGEYTAAAIASIAFAVPAAAVDGNLQRVLSRLLALAADPRTPAASRRIRELAEALVRSERPGDVNQALMDLGATVCTPAAPTCERCPLETLCRGHATGKPTAFPRPRRRAPPRVLTMAFAFHETADGVWLWQRPLDGLWPGLWELPSAEGTRAKARLAQLLRWRLGARLAVFEHELTHRHVQAAVYRVVATADNDGADSVVPDGAGAVTAAHADSSGRTDVLATRAAHPLAVPLGLRAFPDPLAAPLSAIARRAILAARAVSARARRSPR